MYHVHAASMMDCKVSFSLSTIVLIYSLFACAIYSISSREPSVFKIDKIDQQKTHEQLKREQVESSSNNYPAHHQHIHQYHQHPPAQVNSENTLSANSKPQRPIIVPELPVRHYQFWLRNHPRAFKVFEEFCLQAPKPIWNISNPSIINQLREKLSFEDQAFSNDSNYAKNNLNLICSKIKQVRKSCWGYENNCYDIYLMPECSGGAEQEKKIAWFTQADFGYIIERSKEMSKYCSPGTKGNLAESSSFECTKHFTSCRGDNLFIRFKQGTSGGPTNVEKIGALKYCDLQRARINEEAVKAGPLESWFGELGNYDRIEENENCDIKVDRQVFFVKIDSSHNLYNYLGTYINLYATIHLNNRFSSNNQIVFWDAHEHRPGMYEEIWRAFSFSPPINVNQWAGKKVCLDKFIFAMPPRMADGLFNRESFVEGCTKSGLFNAFHEHIIQRLKIPNVYNEEFHLKTKNKIVRLAIISKSDSEVGELEQRIRNESTSYFVQHLFYNSTPLPHLIFHILNSDIIIGLHDPALSYALFAPNWGSLIDLNSYGKPRYENLARLRGISYFTPDINQSKMVKRVGNKPGSDYYIQPDSNDLRNQDEHNDYIVDVDEFMKFLPRVRDQVLNDREKYFNKFEKQAEVDHVKTLADQNPVAAGGTTSPTGTTTFSPPTLNPTTTTHPTTPNPTTTTSSTATSTTTRSPTTTSSTTTTDPTTTSTTTRSPTTTSSTTTTDPTTSSTTTRSPTTTSSTTTTDPTTTSTTTRSPTTTSSTTTTDPTTTTTSTNTSAPSQAEVQEDGKETVEQKTSESSPHTEL